MNSERNCIDSNFKLFHGLYDHEGNPLAIPNKTLSTGDVQVLVFSIN